MHISFERTGGFAPAAMARACTVDSEKLPAEQARELHELVNSADLSNVTSGTPTANKARDAFHYRLQVDVGGQLHALELSEADIPEKLRPLIRWLSHWCVTGVHPSS